MSPITIVGIVLIAIFIILFGFTVYGLSQSRKQTNRELSYAEGVYTGPAGDPWWDGKLPDKVDDYTVPRYVYENLVESTDFLPENGRIIGYRISPSLVIHSRLQHGINPPIFWDYLKRFNGKLLEDDEIGTLLKNWKKVSELRVKAGDTPLECKYFWAMYNGQPVAYNPTENCYKKSFAFPDAWHSLILKR